MYLFFIREFNDIDHITPIVWKMRQDNFPLAVLCLNPEYDLHEVARLIIAREEKLLKQNYFVDRDDMMAYVQDLEKIFSDNSRKDLRWKYGIDEDVLSDSIRQLEFVNWLNKLAIPYSKKTE